MKSDNRSENANAKVGSALEYLEYTRLIVTKFNDAIGETPRPLTAHEVRVKDAALQVLLEYFNGDDPGGDAAGSAGAETPGPEVPVPVPK